MDFFYEKSAPYERICGQISFKCCVIYNHVHNIFMMVGQILFSIQVKRSVVAERLKT